MTNEKISKRKTTLEGFVLQITALLLFILLTSAVILGFLIPHYFKAQEERVYTNALNIYNQNIHKNLDDIDHFLLRYAKLNEYNLAILESRSDVDLYLAEVRLKNQFADDTIDMPLLSGVAWYAGNKHSTVIHNVANQNLPFSGNIRLHLSHLIDQSHSNPKTGWFFYETGEQSYIVRILRNQENYMIGWIDTQQFYASIMDVFHDPHLQYYLSMNYTNYLLNPEVTLSQNYQRIYINSSTPDTPSLELAFPVPQGYFILTNPYITSLIGLLFMICFIFFIHKTLSIQFVNPLNELQRAMNKVKSGNFDVTLPPTSPFNEINSLQLSFQDMADEIEDLKIEIYENEIEQQKAELQYLQRQIQPHFLTNCLNTVQNLLLMQQTSRAKQFIQLLSDYIRYNLSEKTAVTIAEELQHIQNYIKLQQVRYENNLELQLDLHIDNMNFTIPTMIIQTFVENAVKHQLLPDDLLIIRICMVQKQNHLIITIEDNGEGFPEDILLKLKNNETIVKNNISHVGIKNVLRRLNIMYKNQASVTFSNLDHGACVKIMIQINESETL